MSIFFTGKRATVHAHSVFDAKRVIKLRSGKGVWEYVGCSKPADRHGNIGTYHFELKGARQ
jgi:hypothetical protein